MTSISTSKYDFRTQNLGPLSSTFTAPSTCLATTSVTIGYFGDMYFWVGFWTFPAANIMTASDACVPPAETPAPLLDTWYYSPGICPSGYMPEASLATGPSSLGCTSALPSSVTAWLCCPSGYTPSIFVNCGWQNTPMCISTAIGTATLTSVLPWLTTGSVLSITSIPTGAVVTKTVVTESTLSVFAMGIPIMWESTDTEITSWFAQASKGSFTPTKSSTRSYSSVYYTPPTYTSRPFSSSSGSGTNLSTLSLVGIGLSVAGVVLGILGCILRSWEADKAKKALAQSQSEPVVNEPAPEGRQAPPPAYQASDQALRAV